MAFSAKDRFINILFSWDCAILATMTLGNSFPSESISSAAYRAEKFGMAFRHARPVIDHLFYALFGQIDHCAYAYYHCLECLPPDQRSTWNLRDEVLIQRKANFY